MVRGPGWNKGKGLGWRGVCELGPGWVVGLDKWGWTRERYCHGDQLIEGHVLGMPACR